MLILSGDSGLAGTNTIPSVAVTIIVNTGLQVFDAGLIVTCKTCARAVPAIAITVAVNAIRIVWGRGGDWDIVYIAGIAAIPAPAIAV